MENLKLGNKLKEIRKIKGLKQSDVAKLTGVSLRTIQRYEQGLNIPNSFLKIFSSKLKLSLDESVTLDFMSSKKFIDDYDKINYHLNGLLELIGYRIERLYFVGGSIEMVTIQNLFTNDSYIGDVSKFNYGDFILEFLKMLVERDLSGVEPEKNGIDFLKTDEYEKILEKYWRLSGELASKLGDLDIEQRKLNDRESKEIEELKKKLLDKPKKK